MKTLVVYDSRHGFTEHCLTLLAQEAPGLDLWSVRQPGQPDWNGYESVVVGGPVYFARWSTRLRRFLDRHQAALLSAPRLAAFVVSLSPRTAALGYFGRGTSEKLQAKTAHVACFGGRIAWNRLTWWEKVLVKRYRGIVTDVSNLDLAEIQGLAQWLASGARSANPSGA